jgi:hypothetical protein
MPRTGRKIIAVCALLAAAAMLWLERGTIRAGSGEAIFWVIVGVLTIVLASCELLGVGAATTAKK